MCVCFVTLSLFVKQRHTLGRVVVFGKVARMGYFSDIVAPALSLSVTTIGAGVLAIPSTFEDGGILLVVITLTLVSALTVISIDYLVLCVDVLGLRSYEDISRELLGRSFEEAVRWILIIYNLGIAAGYVVVIGEIFTPMLPLLSQYVPFLSGSTSIMVFFWLFIMLPLSCVPQITKLSFVSALAITATFSIAGIIVYRYWFPLEEKDRERMAAAKWNTFLFSYKALLAVPVMMFSFDCQSLSFQLYTNLKTPTRRTMAYVATLSVSVTGFVYLVIGFFGYISNSPEITGNILTNYDPLKDPLVAFGESFYSVTVLIAYVLVLFPCRDAVLLFIFGYNSATHKLTTDAISPMTNFIVSVFISFVSVLLALKASSIVFIIALLGGLCSSTLCFTYPAAFRILLHVRGLARASRAELLIALFMLAFGVIGGVFGTSIVLSL